MEDLTESKLIAAKKQEELLENFKSIFYLLKSKRDTQIKMFSDNRTFDLNAIIQINDRIQQKLHLHEVGLKLVNLTIALSGGKTLIFGNWQEFLKEKWEVNLRTESVTLDWEFEILLPNRDMLVPQSHSIKVRMGRGLRPNEFLQLMMLGGEESELEESGAQMVCKIDFVNSIIATELMNIVIEWYDILPKKDKENRVYSFLDRNINRIVFINRIVILLAGVAFSQPIVSGCFNAYNISSALMTPVQLFILLSYTCLQFVFFDSIANFANRRMSNTIQRLNGMTLLDITIGDRNYNNEIAKKNKSILREVVLKLIVTFISAAIAYGLGKVITIILSHIK